MDTRAEDFIKPYYPVHVQPRPRRSKRHGWKLDQSKSTDIDEQRIQRLANASRLYVDST